LSLEIGFYDGLAFVSYGLIAVSYSMRDIKWLRVITIVACSVDLVVYYYIRAGQPLWVQFGMSILFIAINLYQLYAMARERQPIVFEGEQAWLYERVFSLMSPKEFKRVLATGRWQTASPQQQILSKGGAVDHLAFVVTGRLDALWGDQLMNSVPAGGVVGEISYLTGKPASADVVAGLQSRLFFLAHRDIEKIKSESPDLYNKIMYVLSRQLVDKLASSNRQVANSGVGGLSF
jgi:CRP-like cAMP-binding protein